MPSSSKAYLEDNVSLA